MAMSAQVIQCKYDVLDNIATRFGTQAETTLELYTRVQRTYQTLTQDGWEGRGCEAFVNEMDGELLPAVLRLGLALDTAQTVTLEAIAILRAAEEEAARLFEDGGHTAVPGEAGGNEAGGSRDLPAPKNQQDLFDIVHPTKTDSPYYKLKHNEIKVFKTGDNEYLITLDGTDDFAFNSMNGWPMALASGVGAGTLYTKKLKEALDDLPDGANVHLAGYSQGGIVAQNFLDEGDWLKNHNIKIKSLTTFGSPEPVLGSIVDGKLEGVPYKQFDAAGDPVSHAYGPSLLRVFTHGIVDSTAAQFGIDIVTGGISVHTDNYQSSDTAIGRDLIGDTNLPFGTDQWNLEAVANDANSSNFDVGSAIITEQLSRPVEWGVHQYNDFTNAVGEVVERGSEMVGDAWESISEGTNDMAREFWDWLP
jgi:WXG100 family type VII secretion target